MSQDKKQEAFHLYFQSDLNQQQIAQRIGINRKTLWSWIREGQWRRARHIAATAPSVLVQQYYDQLLHLNEHIATRTDMPYPTPAEADVMRKLSGVIKNTRTMCGPGEMIEIFSLFTHDLISHAGGDEIAREVVLMFDEFIQRRTTIGDQYNYLDKYYHAAREQKEYAEWLSEQQMPAEPEITPAAVPPMGQDGAPLGHAEPAPQVNEPLENNELPQSSTPATPAENKSGVSAYLPHPNHEGLSPEMIEEWEKYKALVVDGNDIDAFADDDTPITREGQDEAPVGHAEPAPQVNEPLENNELPQSSTPATPAENKSGVSSIPPPTSDGEEHVAESKTTEDKPIVPPEADNKKPPVSDKPARHPGCNLIRRGDPPFYLFAPRH